MPHQDRNIVRCTMSTVLNAKTTYASFTCYLFHSWGKASTIPSTSLGVMFLLENSRGSSPSASDKDQTRVDGALCSMRASRSCHCSRYRVSLTVKYLPEVNTALEPKCQLKVGLSQYESDTALNSDSVDNFTHKKIVDQENNITIIIISKLKTPKPIVSLQNP